jgi:predicted transposase YbfD/YdcC
MQSIFRSKYGGKCFIQWTQSLVSKIHGIVALDGKPLRSLGESTSELDAIHRASAFAAENEVILGQLKTSNKGKELERIKLILQLLDLEGPIVTIDARGCHKDVATLIKSKGANYILALKNNQETLLAETENIFNQVLSKTSSEWEKECKWNYFISEERSRNRQEKREVWATNDLNWLRKKGLWKDLRSIVYIKSTRLLNEKTSTEFRYYISCYENDAGSLEKGIRTHWSIKNKVHHVLDVAYKEDACGVRKDNGAENLSVITRPTQNLIKLKNSKKLIINKNRTVAILIPQYLLKILGIAMTV